MRIQAWQLQVCEAAEPPLLFSMLYFTWFSILLPPFLPLTLLFFRAAELGIEGGWGVGGAHSVAGLQRVTALLLYFASQFISSERLVARGAKWYRLLPGANAVLCLHFFFLIWIHHQPTCLIHYLFS